MIAEISVIPIGEGIDLASYVARIVKIIDESGLDYKLNAMGTVVEGDSDRIFDLIKKCHNKMLENAQRVYTTVKIDERKDKNIKMIEHKVQAVEKELGRSLKKYKMRNRLLMPALIFASFILSVMLVSNVMGESAMQSVKGKKAAEQHPDILRVWVYNVNLLPY